MKKKIRANPLIGTRDTDGTFFYNEGGFTIRYAIIKSEALAGKKIPHWLSVKIRRSSYKSGIKKLSEEFADFWHYQKWLFIFQPSTIAISIFIGLIIYFGVIEFQPGKGYLIRWFASRAIGVSSNAIEYRGGGWIRVSGTRTTTDKESELFDYDLNLFRWLVFKDAGSVTRYRGQEYGSVVHPVGADDTGEAYIKKEGEWQKGKIEGAIKWDKPQGSEGKVKGHTIETTEDKLKIRDE